ncbi:PREDICTED: translation initiation factor IF-2-like [Chinchilla lanigera]|uniref:translation initiation factor IF-2-like n=1 Tax=Chinchilla lanigera TaxID=34839 RepID=UPI00069672B2|nr:PREDICTED: translation initiation factor IF-2-like [Chinchilla lanigera]
MRWAERADRFADQDLGCDNSFLLSKVALSVSLPALLPQCPTQSYLQLQRVFSRGGFEGGGKKTRSPPRRPVTASGTGLDSPRAGRILPLRAPGGERPRSGRAAPALPPRRPRASSSRSSSRSPPQPGAEPAPAGRPRLPAARALSGSALGSLPPPAPRSELRETNPGAARKGGSGRRWGPALGPGPGLASPAPSDSPTGSSHSGRELSLCLPRSLSLAPSRLPGRTPGWVPRTPGGETDPTNKMQAAGGRQEEKGDMINISVDQDPNIGHDGLSEKE